MRNRLLGGLPVKDLASRTWKSINEHNCWGTAAELAYYFTLALFPLLIFLLSLVGFLHGARRAIMSALARVMPHDATVLVNQTVDDVVRNRSGGLISLGILGAIWAASSGISALIDTLNTTNGIKENRPYWKVRLISMGLTISLSVLIAGGCVLIVFGNRLANWLSVAVGGGSLFHLLWRLLHYLVGLTFLLCGIELLYYFGPSIRRKWRWVSPGAVFTALSTILVSVLLSVYLKIAPSYSKTYGSLGAVVVLMLWLYLMGLVILVGSEINREIKRGSIKQEPGEPVPPTSTVETPYDQ